MNQADKQRSVAGNQAPEGQPGTRQPLRLIPLGGSGQWWCWRFQDLTHLQKQGIHPLIERSPVEL